MRGGSRYGAGRPSRNGKVESLLRIDVRQWHSRGMLVPGNYFGWQWSRDDEKTASIGVRVSSLDTVTLEYSWRPDGEESRNVTESIPLVFTPCHYGGSRVWFLCPSCRRRVAILYLVKGRWYCRKSINVAYASQSCDEMDRMHRRIAKLESKLAEGGIKPKGMHLTTYNRISAKLDEAESRLDYAFYMKAGRWFELI